MRSLANSMTLALHWRSDDCNRNHEGEGFEAEIHRVAGEIALMVPRADARKLKRISSALSPSRVNSKPSPGNCAPP